MFPLSCESFLYHAVSILDSDLMPGTIDWSYGQLRPLLGVVVSFHANPTEAPKQPAGSLLFEFSTFF